MKNSSLVMFFVKNHKQYQEKNLPQILFGYNLSAEREI